MPGSDDATRPFSIKKIKSHRDIKTILDVGPGVGTYAMALSNAKWKGKITGIEIWEPYIELYSLNQKYSEIILGDVREHNDFNYDLVIFGDILEHMTKEEAIAVWDKVSKQAKYALIAIPIIHYEQGEWGGNPYEAHVKDDWTADEVRDTFSHIVDWYESDITGAFWAKF